MKIALIGYGKMGKEIEQVAIARGHSIDLIIDINNLHDLSKENLSKCDVAIEFTTPSSAVNNIIFCINSSIPVVTGTTGWNNHFHDIENLCSEKHGAIFYASNFSIGVNILFAVNEYLAKLMNKFPDYDVEITEVHHTQKLDSPSGTAISLADMIIENNSRKKSWSLNQNESKDVIPIKAFREGDIKGIHEVNYISITDIITLKHFAKSRRGFAEGAIKAAEFIINKKGIYTMRDLLEI